jgi:hypothetical protein
MARKSEVVMMGTDKRCLFAQDILCIERMLGYKMADRLKDYLIFHYGQESSFLKSQEQAMTLIDTCDIYNSADSCERDGCSGCSTYPFDTLFVQVFRIVHCYQNGLFDVCKDDYRKARKSLSFHWVWH